MITVNGLQVIHATIYVPQRGVWFADLDVNADAPLSGSAVISIGESGEFVARGTVSPEESGSFGLRQRVRVLAGAGGWAHNIGPHDYQSDSGVDARTVAQDAATDCGETLADFSPSAARLEGHFVRQAGPASGAIEITAGDSAWWVGFDGKTRVGSRPAVSAPADSYQVLDYNPRTHQVTLACAPADLNTIGIGSQLSVALDTPIVIGSYRIEISPELMRVYAWCPDPAVRDRLLDNIAALVDAVQRVGIFGSWRYRVIAMGGDRVSCQRIQRRANDPSELPDTVNVSMTPGVAGAHAELTNGAEVTIEFLEGDPTLPRITGFAGKDQPGHVPQVLHLSGGTRPAAAAGDVVNVFFPPSAPIAGTITGVGFFSGLITLTSPGIGTIQPGQAKVQIP